MSWLDALTEEPAPIYGQFIRRESPLGPWEERPALKPERAARRARENELRRQRKALLRALREAA